MRKYSKTRAYLSGLFLLALCGGMGWYIHANWSLIRPPDDSWMWLVFWTLGGSFVSGTILAIVMWRRHVRYHGKGAWMDLGEQLMKPAAYRDIDRDDRILAACFPIYWALVGVWALSMLAVAAWLKRVL